MASIIQTTAVRYKLMGVAPYLDSLGSDMAEAVLQAAIDTATAKFERELQMVLNPTVISMSPAPGDVYDVLEPPLDYDTGMIDRHTLPRWVMRRRPIISVQRLTMQFSNDYRVLDIPSGWWKVNNDMGIVSVLPMGTASVAVQMGIWFMPLLDQAWPWTVIPQFVVCNYTAGWANASAEPRLAEMRDAIGSWAASIVLLDVQRMAPQSISVDGFSQAFSSIDVQVKGLRDYADSFIRSWSRTNRPPQIVVV